MKANLQDAEIAKLLPFPSSQFIKVSINSALLVVIDKLNEMNFKNINNQRDEAGDFVSVDRIVFGRVRKDDLNKKINEILDNDLFGQLVNINTLSPTEAQHINYTKDLLREMVSTPVENEDDVKKLYEIFSNKIMPRILKIPEVDVDFLQKIPKPFD